MSNMKNKRTLEFDVSDAPMLIHAMQIAANTAMMCGHPDARKRFQAYRKVFEQFVPAEAAWFDEETWGDIGEALVTATGFHVYLDLTRFEKLALERGERISWRAREDLDLVIDFRQGEEIVRRFKSKYGFKGKAGDPRVAAVFKVLDDLAPMTCEGSFSDKAEVLDVAA